MWLVVPGFIALRTLESRVAGEKMKAGEALIDIVVFSALNDGIWAVILAALGVKDFSAVSGWGLLVLLVLVVLISPIGLAISYQAIRNALSGPSGTIHLMPKPWDWIFKEHVTEPKQIVFTLQDGRRFGGIWQEPCFASSHPSDEQIFISEVYNVDQVTGQLIDKIPHHAGLLVDKSTIDFIEFFDIDRPMAEMKAPPMPATGITPN